MSVFATVYRIVLRTAVTRGRLVGMAALSTVGLMIGTGIGLADDVDRLDTGTQLVNSFGLSLFAPVVCLVFASAAFGDLIDDASLVYLWLRPVSRRLIVTAAAAAVLSVTLPLVVGPLVLSAVLSGGGGDLVRGTLIASVVGVAAYCGLFMFAGARFRRALPWGLAYILIWEGFVATAGKGASRLALRAYTRSILSQATGVELRLSDISSGNAVLVPVLVLLAGLVLTVRVLLRREVA